MRWEWKKIMVRFTWVLTAFLLLLTVFLTWMDTAAELTPEGKAIRHAQTELFTDYFERPDVYAEDYAAYEEQEAEYQSWLRKVMYADDNPGEFTWVNRKIDVPGYGDKQLYEDVLAQIHRSETYQASLSRILHDAYKQLKELGMRRGEFLYEYTVNLILHYEPLQNRTISPENIRGWDRFFAMKSPTILLALAVVGLCSRIFLLEKRTGMDKILTPTRYGGTRLRLSKIGTVGLLSACLTLLFTCVPLPVLACTTGLSGMGAQVQTVAGLENCPYPWSIGQYLAAYLGFRVLVFFLLGLFSAVLGQVTGSESVTLGTMFLFFILNAVLPSSPLALRHPTYTFFDIAFAHVFLEQYRGLEIFGLYSGTLPFMLLFLLVAALLLTAVSLCVPGYVQLPPLGRFLQNRRSGKKSTRTRRLSVHRPSIPAFEWYKICLSPRTLLWILALLSVRFLWMSTVLHPAMSLEEGVWAIYIDDMQNCGGLVGEATDACIREKQEEFDRVYADFERAEQAKKDGTGTEETFRACYSKKKYADVTFPIYRGRLLSRQGYLKQQAELHPDVTHPLAYVNDTGFEQFLFPPLDVPFLLFLLLLLPKVFSYEVQTGFSSIQRMCRRGRKETFRSKCAVTVTVVLVVQLLCAAMDAGLFLVRFDSRGLSASLLSLPLYQEIPWDISIGTYLVLVRLSGMLGGVLLTLLGLAISERMSSIYKSMFLLTLVLGLPYLLGRFGVSFLAKGSVASVLHPGMLPAAVGVYLVYAVCACAGFFAARRHWLR